MRMRMICIIVFFVLYSYSDINKTDAAALNFDEPENANECEAKTNIVVTPNQKWKMWHNAKVVNALL